MKTFYRTVTIMMAGLILSTPVKAQEISEASFADFIKTMPRPKATISETVAIYDNYQAFDKEVQNVYKQVNGNLDFIYRPWFGKFKNNLERSKQDKAFLSALSPEEKHLLENFRTMIAGLSSEGQFTSFHLLIPDRPLIGSGKSSWGKVAAPLSPAVQALYQQVLQIEKELNWPAFKQIVQTRTVVIGGFKNEELDVLNEKLQADLKRLPRKKVKIFDGVTTEMEDPSKAIALHEQNEVERQKIFQKQYSPEYVLWKDNFNRMETATEKLDAILIKINYGKDLEGNDKQLIPVVADVQARLWEMLTHLTSIAQGTIHDAQLAESSKALLKQNIDIYKKYAESIE